MNTLAHLVGIIAAIGLAVVALDTLSNEWLGFAMLGVGLVLFVLLVEAVLEDWNKIVRGR